MDGWMDWWVAGWVAGHKVKIYGKSSKILRQPAFLADWMSTMWESKETEKKVAAWWDYFLKEKRKGKPRRYHKHFKTFVVFQKGLFKDISIGIKNAKVMVACVSEQVCDKEYVPEKRMQKKHTNSKLYMARVLFS